MKSRILGAVSACLFALGTTSSSAALDSRLGGQAVYDTDLNITWIADANLAASNSFGLTYGENLGTHPLDSDGIGINGVINSNGSMNWPGALHWIDAMNADGGGTGYLGFNDWRLPITAQPDSSCSGQTGDVPPQGFGTGCIGSEMGHLYNIEGVTFTTPGLFSNLEINYYWSGTVFAPDPTFDTWGFRFFNGDQDALARSTSIFRALAVRSGDVSAVPVPAAAWLFASGLIGLIGIARRKKAT